METVTPEHAHTDRQDAGTIRCRYCGASFAYGELKCPFCGNVHRAGAEKDFMENLDRLREDLDDLAAEDGSDTSDAPPASSPAITEDHDKNIARYDRSYRQSKAAVGGRLKKGRFAAWQWVLTGCFAMAFAVMLFVHVNAFSVFHTRTLERRAARDFAKNTQLLDDLLAQGDYLAFRSFIHHYEIRGILDDYTAYRAIIPAADEYAGITDALASELIAVYDYNPAAPKDYMAFHLARFYEKKPDDADPYAVYYADMDGNIRILLSHYYDLTDTDINALTTMTESAMKAFFAERRGDT